MLNSQEQKSIMYRPVAGFFCRHYARPTYEREMIDEGNRLVFEIDGIKEDLLKKTNFYNFTSAVVGSLTGAAIHLFPALWSSNIAHRMGASDITEKVCAVTILAIPALTNAASCVYESVRLARKK